MKSWLSALPVPVGRNPVKGVARAFLVHEALPIRDLYAKY
ncbi:hypothetical protein KPSA3_04542 [Pseudomonas syringae pv. actinidiae]|uniref:Uncharacterized protein n=1 Tax=Pseudomonas syringae pv. actinidiae TaxID=103796 RepID=A0AAN4TMP7_PSESF|nr:hypothetical protein KPSA3_04542 [Pseudomonas syringae pv. actinidiae]